MGKKKGYCYRCGAKATSKEHVPPLCFFPEEKDIGFDCFRVNLITVPACHEHNGKKSKDDEFLMACLSGVVGNNSLGLFHTRTKVKRIFDINGPSFIHTIARNAQDHIWKYDGHVYPVVLGSPNLPRMVDCFESIAYGIYYHEFKRIFKGECLVFCLFLTYNEGNREKAKLFLKKRWEYEPKMPLKGHNPDVFKYQFSLRDKDGFVYLKMIFYEGTEVLVCFKDEDIVAPFDIVGELIKAGIKTTVEFPDGNIEFN